MSERIIDESRKYVIRKLKSTKRDGITDLIEHMKEVGFFTAPASGGNHMSCEGGLVVHTAGVMRLAEKFGKILYLPEDFKRMKPSIYIVAALHDLGKAGAFGKVYYAENMIKDGRPTKANPEQRYKRSESKPYQVNKDMLHIDHPQLSVKEADLYIELTEEEYFAILFHDGLYGSMAYYLKGHERPLQTLLHYADYWCAHFVEGKTIPEPEPEEEAESKTAPQEAEIPF